MRISDWSSDVCSSDLEIEVVESARYAADHEQRSRRQGGRRRDPLRHQSHRSEDEGERNGREDLEDALDPQMDDPPAPILHDRAVLQLAIEKTRAINTHEGTGSAGKQHENTPLAFALPHRP